MKQVRKDIGPVICVLLYQTATLTVTVMNLDFLCTHEQPKKPSNKSTMVVIQFKKKKVEACKRRIKSDKPRRKILPSSLKSQSKYFRRSCHG